MTRSAGIPALADPRGPHGPHDEDSWTHHVLASAEAALSLPEPPESRWHRAGVGRRGERVFNVVSGAVLALFAAGWSWSIATARAEAMETGEAGGVTPVTAGVAAALTETDAPTAAYLTDAALSAFAASVTPLRGESGKLRARIATPGAAVLPDSLPEGASVAYSERGARGAGPAAGSAVRTPPVAPVSASDARAPQVPGIWQLALRLGGAVSPLSNFNVITLTPFSAKRGGRVGLYFLGNWPTERRRAPRPNYAPPSGFIEVTPQNQDTPLSDHFRLRDFLTHDQQNVWPKYLVVDTKLVDKLELVLAELESRGIDVHGVHVMSGFRTPQYNVSGGDPTGRAGLSRHMYGDAADIFIDSNGDGVMDDLNHDGRVDMRDSRFLCDVVERVEREHPALVGGCGVYTASGGHGPFTHIDTRGYRARWVSSGDG
ncbi:MAG TPA: hypothetical protein VNS52_00350 [Gemmatimonadaceae bacterium]|nr:hypothetical protein [Gemmatimonadaceae bacterium]